MASEGYWTNKSVVALAKNNDPIKIISEKAKSVIFRFLEDGGQGPPFDPFEIAAFLKIDVRPSEDVRDAKTLFLDGKHIIEYNPNRSVGRINFSVSHDIAHTFFPDCKDETRNRANHKEMTADDWQLEMLCNIGAAELLMPMGSFPDLAEEKLSIEKLLELQKQFNVSMEALLLRFVKLTKQNCWVFAASRPNPEKSIYKIDYAVPSNHPLPKIQAGLRLPQDSVVSDCTAIGFTATGTETWHSTMGPVKVECIGLSAYPGNPFPRVLGFAKPTTSIRTSSTKPDFVRGDATRPRGSGKKIIAFIVNDATPRWGAGFALAVRRRWPSIQEQFINWAGQNRKQFVLGRTVLSQLDEDIDIAQMICQKGYGVSKRPRLRYAALEDCLGQLADAAIANKASIHMPRIGSGQARGNWSIIFEMIQRLLLRQGLHVVIYDLPNSKTPRDEQKSLLFSE